jgi:hypothetical protein
VPLESRLDITGKGRMKSLLNTDSKTQRSGENLSRHFIDSGSPQMPETDLNCFMTKLHCLFTV